MGGMKKKDMAVTLTLKQGQGRRLRNAGTGTAVGLDRRSGGHGQCPHASLAFETLKQFAGDISCPMHGVKRMLDAVQALLRFCGYGEDPLHLLLFDYKSQWSQCFKLAAEMPSLELLEYFKLAAEMCHACGRNAFLL